MSEDYFYFKQSTSIFKYFIYNLNNFYFYFQI